jgi:uncharacterized protein (TIRG00374 family)
MVSKKLWINLGKYGLGLALLGFAIWKTCQAPANGKGPTLPELLRGPIAGWALAAAAVLIMASVLITFVRWYVLVRAQDLPFTLTNALRLGLIGYCLNTVLPGSIGGDIVKATFIARQQSRRTRAVSTVLIDRGIGLWALIWLVAALGGTFWLCGDAEIQHNQLLQTIVIVALGLVGFTSLLWVTLVLLPEFRGEKFAGRLLHIPKVGVAAAEFWRAVWMYRRNSGSIFLSLVLSWISQIGNVLGFYFAARSFSAAAEIPTVVEHFLLIPVGMIFQAGIPTPGGVGAEGFYGVLYQMVGKPDSVGFAGALTQRFITIVLGLVGYIVYLQMRPALRDAKEVETAEEEAAAPSPALSASATEG